MNKIFGAIALSIAIPSVAQAQAPQAPMGKMMSDQMKEKCGCCKDMAAKDHGGHNMSAGRDPHAGHTMTPKTPSTQRN